MKLSIYSRLIILLCLFLSVCSNKIRKREDIYEKLDLDEINKANEVLELWAQEKNKEKKNWFFDLFSLKPPIKFFDARFVIQLLKNSNSKNFILDEARISYTYEIFNMYQIKSFKYKCGSMGIFKSKKYDINLSRFPGYNTYGTDMAISQHIVLRKCLEKLYNCIDFDNLCIIENFALRNGLEIIKLILEIME